MNRLFALVLVMASLWLPTLAQAADCAESTIYRNNTGYIVHRWLLADGKTTTGASTKCSLPSLSIVGGGNTANAPWDFYRFYAEAGNTCTSWTAAVRDYPINANTALCRGTCDSDIVVTLDSTGTTSRTFREPLGEAEDVNVTAINCSGGLSVFAEFYYRNESR